jgi:hypothetical protein
MSGGLAQAAALFFTAAQRKSPPMLIRFKVFTNTGNIQFHAGQVIDLPSELAAQHIDAGDAVAVPKVEASKLRYQNAPAPAFPRARKPNRA